MIIMTDNILDVNRMTTPKTPDPEIILDNFRNVREFTKIIIQGRVAIRIRTLISKKLLDRRDLRNML